MSINTNFFLGVVKKKVILALINEIINKKLLISLE